MSKPSDGAGSFNAIVVLVGVLLFMGSCIVLVICGKL